MAVDWNSIYSGVAADSAAVYDNQKKQAAAAQAAEAAAMAGQADYYKSLLSDGLKAERQQALSAELPIKRVLKGHAGGVAVSGLEMAQNSQHLNWTREEVDDRLRKIMHSIHETARCTAEEYGQPDNYVLGANIAGFVKVANAMIAQGIV